MRLLLPACASLLLLAACGDDSGGDGGAGGGTSSSSAAGTTSTTSSTAASTSGSTASATTAAGTGGAGGAGGSEDVGSGGFGGASVDLACPDTDLEEQDLGELDDDPEAGDFTLDEALDGLPEGDGPLRAIFDTDLGSITCELFPDIAPVGVASFVGLARGRRPWLDPETDHWVLGRRFYDGLTFHRVIDDFVAQGGDPLGTGFGDAGYAFDNETDNDESHTPGTLAYANAGNDHSNGSQFFIVAEEPAEFLDGDYTIFGRCEPIGLIDAITELETDEDDMPVEPFHMNRVHITRCPPAD